MGIARLSTIIVGVSLVAAWTSACSSPTPPPTAPPPASTRSVELWGDMTPVVSVKELMVDMIDPLADYVFNAVGIVVNRKGTTEWSPKTDEDWEKIRIGGVALAEGSYLLKVPRPFAPAGDLNNSTGPEAVELAPDQITAKVKADPVEWNARIEALRNVGLQVIDIVKRKDTQELWDASDNLEMACENCHRSYWYPGETSRFYEKLDRRLNEIRRRSPGAAEPRPPSKARNP